MPKATFPGWRVVAGCFLVLATNCGLGFYGLAVYLNAFSKEKGWNIASISFAGTVYFIVAGFASVFVARLISKVDVRWVVTAGAVIGGASLASFGMVRSVWQLYVAYSFFALGFAGAGLVPVTTVVTRWFSRRRSVALSVASSGLSVGGILLTPLAKWIIDRYGIAAAAPWLGVAFVLGIVPFVWWLMLPEPAQYGWAPDGDAAPPRADETELDPAATGVVGESMNSAIRSRYFILLTIGYILALGSQVGAIQHLVKLAEERTGASAAALATLVLALVSVIARLLGGWLAEVVPMNKLTTAVAASQGVSLILLAFAQGTGSLFIAIAVFGATVGNLLMLQPLLLAARFGVRDYARIYSRAMMYVIIGNAGGPYLLGWLRDAAGSYQTAYVVAGVLSIGGAFFIAAAGPATVEAEPVLQDSSA